MNKPSIIITSIASSKNRVLQTIAKQSIEKNYEFIVIGDESSPKDFYLEGCAYYGLQDQQALNFEYASLCPTRKYGRKNIGYLLAIKQKSPLIIETDDDNIPLDTFWNPRKEVHRVPIIDSNGEWVNVYRYFTKAHIWPRGLPLDAINLETPSIEKQTIDDADCPIQQGLADRNPDVDAVYRMILPLPLDFEINNTVALGRGSWCPFNSQNTTWWPKAYPLLYLPIYCSFRMTDIWRSFVVQRIAWENNWHILFHSPTVFQERNEHDLMKDFIDEIDGYKYNRSICNALERLNLKSGVDYLGDNMYLCYEKMVALGHLKKEELNLLRAWLNDLNHIS